MTLLTTTASVWVFRGSRERPFYEKTMFDACVGTEAAVRVRRDHSGRRVLDSDTKLKSKPRGQAELWAPDVGNGLKAARMRLYIGFEAVVRKMQPYSYPRTFKALAKQP